MIMFHALINEGRKEELSKSVLTKKFQQAGFHLYLIFEKRKVLVVIVMQRRRRPLNIECAQVPDYKFFEHNLIFIK